MTCAEAQELLSPYFDGELSHGERARVAAHLDQCSVCARELARFEKLSELAHATSTPTPPEQIWTHIEAQLGQRERSLPPRRRFRSPRLLLAMVAAVFVVAGIGWFAFHKHPPHGSHSAFAEVFEHYLHEFQRDPTVAHHTLLAKYENWRVEPAEAIDYVGYRPAIANELPPEYSLDSTYVLKMPCCTCVHTICHRAGGTALAIFEHNDEDPMWFGDRATVSVACHGKTCCLVGLGTDIATTWKSGNRYITIIGIDDVSELRILMSWLDGLKTPSS